MKPKQLTAMPKPDTIFEQIDQRQFMQAPAQEHAHVCNPLMLDLCYAFKEQHIFTRNKWVEVWRCRVCKEMYVQKVKL